jgi:hypothetical protein
MRKGLAIIFLAVFIVSFIPSPVSAGAYENIHFYPCIAEDGSYKLTISVGNLNGVNGVPVESTSILVISSQVRIRKNGGAWHYYTYGTNGLTLKYGNLPEGTKFEVEHYYGSNGLTSISTSLNGVLHGRSITLSGKDYPACFEKCYGNPIFKMYLLTREDSYCILVSDVHPSVESQKALCFPGTDWVATRTACEGWVCDSGCWDCDYLGFSRLTMQDLMKIYERRMGQ